MGDSVFINGRAVVHKQSAGKAIAFPDVCLCPPPAPAGPIPTPLPNTVQAADLDGGAPSVLVEGNPVGKRSSFFKKSTGNEVAQSTGGGVVSHVVQGKAHFQSYSMNVMIEGEEAVRHADLLTHNHAGQPGNTPPTPWMSVMDAPPAKPAEIKSERKGKTWIGIELVDQGEQPVPGARYRVKLADGSVRAGRLRADGTIVEQAVPEGPCEVTVEGLPSKPGLPSGKNHRLTVELPKVTLEMEWDAAVVARLPDDLVLCLTVEGAVQRKALRRPRREGERARVAFQWKNEASATSLVAFGGGREVSLWSNRVVAREGTLGSLAALYRPDEAAGGDEAEEGRGHRYLGTRPRARRGRHRMISGMIPARSCRGEARVGRPGLGRPWGGNFGRRGCILRL
jgi:hypothetical protein